jgi:hypothetical protein
MIGEQSAEVRENSHTEAWNLPIELQKGRGRAQRERGESPAMKIHLESSFAAGETGDTALN